MKINVERDPILRALSRVQTVVEQRNNSPILGNVLIETKDGRIKISATNMEVSIITTCPADVVEPGSITVSAKTLFEIVRELPRETVVISRGDRYRMRLCCGQAKFELACLPCDIFPAIPEINGPYKFEMDQRMFLDMLNKTHFATSYDENRFTLNGLFFQVTPSEEDGKESVVRIVATDTHRLAMVERFFKVVFVGEFSETHSEIKEVIIPKKAIKEIRKLLGDGEKKVEIILEKNYIQLILPGIILTSKLLEGRFPDYRPIIPKESNIIVVVNRYNLLDVVKRMNVLSNEKSQGISMEIDRDKMRINVINTEHESADDEIDISMVEGDELTVGFNARYLKDFLDVMDGDDVHLSIKNDESPVLLMDPSNRGSKFVLMPMRI